MRKSIFLFFSFLSYFSFSQTGRPYAIWEDQVAGVYKYVQLDANTGTKTEIAPIPGILGFVMGNISCMDPVNNYYHFAALSGSGLYLFYTLDASTGAVISNPVLTENIIGVEYNCADAKLYALREISNNYDIVRIDPATAVSITVASIGFLSGYVGGSFCLNTQLGYYSFVALTGSVFVLKTYNINSGSLVASTAFPDNVVGHKYSCLDNSMYGLWEDAGVYKLERIDQVTGLHTTSGILAGVNPGFVLESQSVDENGYYTFRGFDSLNNFALFTVDLSTAAITATAPTFDNAVGFEEFSCCALTAMDALNKQPVFSIFPNPSNEEITIQTSDEIEWIEIITLDGKQKKLLKDVFKKKIAINISDFTPGMYMIKTGSKKTVSNQKLIIN